LLVQETATRPGSIFNRQGGSIFSRRQQSDVLPLIYIWNENRKLGSFTVSVNGSALGYLLEALVPRSNLSFIRIRDESISVIVGLSNKMIVSVCEKTGAFPSDIFL
jgi:hypothetical protein